MRHRLLLFILSLAMLGPPLLAQQQQGPTVISTAGTGSDCATAGTCVVLVTNYTSASNSITIEGNGGGNTISFEATTDNVPSNPTPAQLNALTWFPLQEYPSNSSTAATTATTNGIWGSGSANYTAIRARCSTFVSGTATVTIKAAPASFALRGGAGGGGGTVTQLNTGTGLTGGPITGSGTISISNTAVTPGSYNPAKITVNQQGQLTAGASSIASDIVGLFSTCSGTQYLGADGACHTASGLSGLTQGNEVIASSSTTATAGAHVYLSQTSGADLCAKLNTAFTANPNGVVIEGDLGGNQACSAANAQAAFSNCNNARYEPIVPTALWLPVVAGTASLPLGNKCRGIFGMGRAAAGSGGTGLSIQACTGLNTPVTGCAAPTVQSYTGFTIAAVAATGGHPAYAHLHGTFSPVPSGGDYVLLPCVGASCPGTNASAANSGRFRICQATTGAAVQNDAGCPANPNGTDIYYVNANAATCAANCGTLYDSSATTLIGLGPAASGFGTLVKDIAIDCDNILGLTGISNNGSGVTGPGSSEEDSGWGGLIITSCVDLGEDIHGNQAQNSGPYGPDEIYIPATDAAGGANSNCNLGTTGIVLGDTTTRGINGVTVSAKNGASDCTGASYAAAARTGFYLDATQNKITGSIHCEGYSGACFELGQNSPATGIHITEASGMPSGGTTAIDISSNFGNTGLAKFTSDVTLVSTKKNTGPTNTIVNNISGCTITEPVTAFYVWDQNGASSTTITSSKQCPSIFGDGVYLNGSSSGSVQLTTPSTGGQLNVNGPVNATTGFQIGGAATNNHCLLGNGTNFVDAACPSGFSNPMTTLGDIMYENATPAAARLAGYSGVVGVPAILQSTATSGPTAAAPIWNLAGVPVNNNSETSCSGGTLNILDRATAIFCSGGTTATWTLPVHSTAGFGLNFPYVQVNNNSGTLTLSPTTDTIDTASVLSKWADFLYNNGSGNWQTINFPTLAAFPACTGVLQFSTTTGFSCNTTPTLTLTNATGLPISTGVSGLGTGIATALGDNVGSAGAPVVNGGALGTPSSGTLTNATGYLENNLTGASAAGTITEGGSTFSVTRAGVSTAALTAPWVFQNTNSTNNNTSITMGITAPGTSTGQTVLNVNGAATGGDLVDLGTGGTWTAGALSGQTIVDAFKISGALALGTANCTTFGTAGPICLGEGTAPTNVASTAAIYSDSTAHELKVATNGSTSFGTLVRAQPGAISLTAQAANIVTATLCAASAGACNIAGEYHIHLALHQDGTACTANTTNGVSVQLTWTDSDGTAHSAQTIPLISSASLVALTGTMAWPATGVTAYASGDFVIDTNGTIIQYATTYANCTTGGAAKYAINMAVTRLQ